MTARPTTIYVVSTLAAILTMLTSGAARADDLWRRIYNRAWPEPVFSPAYPKGTRVPVQDSGGWHYEIVGVGPTTPAPPPAATPASPPAIRRTPAQAPRRSLRRTSLAYLFDPAFLKEIKDFFDGWSQVGALTAVQKAAGTCDFMGRPLEGKSVWHFVAEMTDLVRPQRYRYLCQTLKAPLSASARSAVAAQCQSWICSTLSALPPTNELGARRARLQLYMADLTLRCWASDPCFTGNEFFVARWGTKEQIVPTDTAALQIKHGFGLAHRKGLADKGIFPKLTEVKAHPTVANALAPYLAVDALLRRNPDPWRMGKQLPSPYEAERMAEQAKLVVPLPVTPGTPQELSAPAAIIDQGKDSLYLYWHQNNLVGAVTRGRPPNPFHNNSIRRWVAFLPEAPSQ